MPQYCEPPTPLYLRDVIYERSLNTTTGPVQDDRYSDTYYSELRFANSKVFDWEQQNEKLQIEKLKKANLENQSIQ